LILLHCEVQQLLECVSIKNVMHIFIKNFLREHARI